MHAIVVADGDAPDPADLEASWPGWALDASLVVAADGGARGAERLGLRTDLVVGDGDSLGPVALASLEAAGVAVERAPIDKDESDTELAVHAAVQRGADRITIVGAFGGARLDHELANVGLLALDVLATRRACLLDARARVSLVRAPGPHGGPVERGLPGPVGAVVSLLPAGGPVRGITTRGLRYPLHDGSLVPGPARGLSNVREEPDAAVVVREGRLLVVESPATLRP